MSEEEKKTCLFIVINRVGEFDYDIYY